MAGKFELKQAKNGEYHFNLLAGNGQIILTSEMYKTKASAENGIESVKKKMPKTMLAMNVKPQITTRLTLY